MEGNKYKLLMKIPLTDLEIVKGKISTIELNQLVHYITFTVFFFNYFSKR